MIRPPGSPPIQQVSRRGVRARLGTLHESLCGSSAAEPDAPDPDSTSPLPSPHLLKRVRGHDVTLTLPCGTPLGTAHARFQRCRDEALKNPKSFKNRAGSYWDWTGSARAAGSSFRSNLPRTGAAGAPDWGNRSPTLGLPEPQTGAAGAPDWGSWSSWSPRLGQLEQLEQLEPHTGAAGAPHWGSWGSWSPRLGEAGGGMEHNWWQLALRGGACTQGTFGVFMAFAGPASVPRRTPEFSAVQGDCFWGRTHGRPGEGRRRRSLRIVSTIVSWPAFGSCSSLSRNRTPRPVWTRRVRTRWS
ncbi:hypothetical protein D4764_17G0009410 [Takifugu flavidus]|uniref:Uncharacterized protein n=1 Tax=Takifugu flavidus TaxID=433684 RepID=A0A5C6NXC3_9TELE|nr:hypothetical protein D4764_17G0009410 [Takifugu flavidus]